MKARKEKEKLSMETYIDFVLSRKQSDLKVDFLNQVYFSNFIYVLDIIVLYLYIYVFFFF